MMNKIIIALVLLLFPICTFGQEIINSEPAEFNTNFKATVIEVLEQKNSTRDDGSTLIQQKLKLTGLEGAWKDKEIIFDGTEHDVTVANEYSVGDTVLVYSDKGLDGENNFYIMGYSRTSPLFWLVFLFAFIVIAIGRFKGMRALIVLFFSFVIILKFIIPKIL